MKILCVCQHGANRSVVLATLLKLEYGYPDSLSCGVDQNSKETLEMLINWADKVLIVDQYVLDRLTNLGLFKDKFLLINVGGDRWGQQHNSELQQLFRDKLKEFKLND